MNESLKDIIQQEFEQAGHKEQEYKNEIARLQGMLDELEGNRLLLEVLLRRAEQEDEDREGCEGCKDFNGYRCTSAEKCELEG